MAAPKGHKKWGGKKKGSKHKETIEKEMALEVMRKIVLKKWQPLIDKKIELAEGVFVKNLKGVYKEKPDSQSLEYLFSMVVGRPKEAVDLNISNIKELQGFISSILKK